MAFDKQAPTWSAPGVEPPESKKQEGWQVNDKPPAAWLNWFMSLTAESLKELQQKAAEKSDITTINSEIDGLKQSGVDGKNRLETAIIAKEGTVSKQGQVATFEELDNGIHSIPTGIDTSDATAAAGDLISGKTAYGPIGKITGTIPDRGAGGTVTPGATDQTKAAGRYTSAITIKGEPNLIAGNLPKDKTFFGIIGLLERMTTAEKQAIANAITGKGVAASAGDTNTVLAQKIGQIDKGKQFAQGTVVPTSSNQINIPFSTFYPKVGVLWRGNGNGSIVDHALLLGRIADPPSSPANYGPLLGYGVPGIGTAMVGFSNQLARGDGTVGFYMNGALGYTLWNYMFIE